MVQNKTKIIATIGPACLDRRILSHMVRHGLDCARINTAHGDFRQYKRTVELIRKIKDIPILIDIKGPEIRIRTAKDIIVDNKTRLKVYFGKKDPHFSCDFYKQAKTGKYLYFDNGQIKSRIIRKGREGSNAFVLLRFYSPATILPNKGVNLPNMHVELPCLSGKDLKAIRFAIKNRLSFIALSFVRNKEDVLNLRKKIGKHNLKIISKIENHEGINNIDEIIDASDGIMIARGDLGIELPQEKIPYLQKHIIDACIQKAKISIVATQMLESMMTNPRPTRAEVSDVANAVLDGADAVMLSGETAMGRYPATAVQAMSRIAREIESKITSKVRMDKTGNVSEEMSKSAYHLGRKANKIICITRSGYVARLVSRFRLHKDILAITDDKAVRRQLELVWGVKPIIIRNIPNRAIFPRILRKLYKSKLIEKQDVVICLGAIWTLKEQILNLIELHQVKDLFEYQIKKFRD